MKKSFLPNLEVRDEGGYWEERDVSALAHRLAQLGATLDGLAEGMRDLSLTPEAAEDPAIVATRIERIAPGSRRMVCALCS